MSNPKEFVNRYFKKNERFYKFLKKEALRSWMCDGLFTTRIFFRTAPMGNTTGSYDKIIFYFIYL